MTASPAQQAALQPTRASLWLHTLASLSAAVLLLTALPRVYTGNVLMDAAQGCIVFFGGIILGGWWWCVVGVQRSRPAGGLLSVISVASLLAFGKDLPPFVAVLLSIILAGWSWVCSEGTLKKIGAFFSQVTPWNAVFFGLLVVLNTAADAAQLHASPPGLLTGISFVLERLFTHLVIASVMWVLLMVYACWSPRSLRWAAWAVVMLAPLLVIVDTVLRLMWTKSIAQFCAEMEIGRSANLLQVFHGAGFHFDAERVFIITACVAACYALLVGCSWLSQRFGLRANPTRFVKIGLGAWVTLIGIQATQVRWMTPAWHQWQARASSLHLSPFPQYPGLVSFDVTVSNPVLPETARATRKPDMFLFIVETLRADALRKDVAPSMAEMRDLHCQQINDTRSAANATHLSWFAILHGRLPVFWDEGRKRAEAAPLLSLLHNADYQVEVRDGGTFDYLDMELTNFGDGEATQVFEHIPNTDPQRLLSTPEREVQVFSRLRDSVTQSSPGGHFWLTGIDSTHYPYGWHEDWKPPFDNYEENPIFPPLPSPEQIQRVHRRYLNSVAWDDHLIGGFISFLKSSGRFEESIIVITGDHGEEFKEHGSWFHCSGLNKEQTNVPVLIKWPSSWGRGPVLNDASHLDITPSLLDAAGFPESVWDRMPGRSLLKNRNLTSIVATSQTGTRGEAMLWRRDGYEAAFSWPSPWLPLPPQKMWLERLQGPNGPIRFNTPADYETELRRLFPDAFARMFDRCERIAP